MIMHGIQLVHSNTKDIHCTCTQWVGVTECKKGLYNGDSVGIHIMATFVVVTFFAEEWVELGMGVCELQWTV